MLQCLEGLADLHAFLGEASRARELYALGEKQHVPTAHYYCKWASFEKNQSKYETARKLYQKAHDQNPQARLCH